MQLTLPSVVRVKGFTYSIVCIYYIQACDGNLKYIRLIVDYNPVVLEYFLV